MEKLNICVIFGGVSSEHEVSLVSATTVIDSLNKDKYNVHMVGITKDGKWRYYDGNVGDIVKFDTAADKYRQAIISPDRADGGLLVFGDSGIEKIKIDAAIPAMHGRNGGRYNSGVV